MPVCFFLILKNNFLVSIEKNQYLYQNKIVILRVYLLIVRQGNSLKFIKQKWIKCLYSKYDYNLKNIKSMISDSTFNSPNFPKNLKELFMDNHIIYNNMKNIYGGRNFNIILNKF